jgi:hypothetical protein
MGRHSASAEPLKRQKQAWTENKVDNRKMVRSDSDNLMVVATRDIRFPCQQFVYSGFTVTIRIL